jgi:hypothetical protein
MISLTQGAYLMNTDQRSGENTRSTRFIYPRGSNLTSVGITIAVLLLLYQQQRPPHSRGNKCQGIYTWSNLRSACFCGLHFSKKNDVPSNVGNYRMLFYHFISNPAQPMIFMAWKCYYRIEYLYRAKTPERKWCWKAMNRFL